MKFLFSNPNEDDAESQFQGGLKKTLRFHKNLFFGNLPHSGSSADPSHFESESDEYETEEEDYAESSFNRKISKTSKFYRLNNLSLPLSDTFGEYVQELSNERFFLDDLSFIFEMSRNQSVSPYAIIVAMLYLKRLRSKSFDSVSSDLGISNMELCLISILLASKYLTDEGEPEEIYNDDWARAADLSVADINRLEKRILNRMDWNLYVSNEEFVNFSKELAQKTTLKKIKLQLDMCTYSDLDCLLSLSTELSVEKVRAQIALLSKVFFVCSSTLVYLLFSSLLVSSCLVYLRSHIVSQYQLSILKHASLFINQPPVSSLPQSNQVNATKSENDIASLCVLNMRGATMNDYDSIESLLNGADKSASENNRNVEKSSQRMANGTLSMTSICNKPKNVFAPYKTMDAMDASIYNLHKPRMLGADELFRSMLSTILVK